MNYDNAPVHGIPRPLIVNGCPVCPCDKCGTLWTDHYLTYDEQRGGDMFGLCPECGGDELDPELMHPTISD
jgi:hypothetical protein